MKSRSFNITITRKNLVVTNDKITTYIVLSSKTSRCSISGETGYLQGLAEDLLQIERESNKPLLLGERQKAILGPSNLITAYPQKNRITVKAHHLYPPKMENQLNAFQTRVMAVHHRCSCGERFSLRIKYIGKSQAKISKRAPPQSQANTR